jgi:nitrite reductase/ring-hydroxylating ferredoxin subunit
VRTGAPAAVPCTEPIRTYRAMVEDGVVVIDYR